MVCTPSPSPHGEPLPSALDNFTRLFFGVVTKEVQADGTFRWILPDGINDPEPVPTYTRLENEGLAEYFLRVVADLAAGQLTGLQGDAGAAGDPGTDGSNAFTLTVGEYTQPAVAETVGVDLLDNSWVVVGQVLFLDTGGYYKVTALAGSGVTLENLGYPGNAAPAEVVPTGRRTAPGGFIGATGATGQKGAVGDKGDQGDQGDAGTNGIAAKTTVTADFYHPAVGANVVVEVANNTWCSVGQPIFVPGVGGGGVHYSVVALIGTTGLTLQNIGVSGDTPQTNETAFNGYLVTPSGRRGPPPVAGETSFMSRTLIRLTDYSTDPDDVFLDVQVPDSASYTTVITLPDPSVNRRIRILNTGDTDRYIRIIPNDLELISGAQGLWLSMAPSDHGDMGAEERRLETRGVTLYYDSDEEMWLVSDQLFSVGVITGLESSAHNANDLTLSWSPISSADRYDVLRDGVVVAAGLSTTTFLNVGLAPSTEYTFRVRGRSVTGPGSWSLPLASSTTA